MFQIIHGKKYKNIINCPVFEIISLKTKSCKHFTLFSTFYSIFYTFLIYNHLFGLYH